MPILRLAYIALFLLAILAVFELWAQVGGQEHLDLLPWHVKLVLGVGAAYACTKASAAAVAERQAWNGRTRAWFAALVALSIGCGLASYYSHLYLETDEDRDQAEPDKAVAAAPAAHGPRAPVYTAFRRRER
jgi:hypothetical protein